MALVDFYMQTTGDDLNSGSDTNDAAAYTSTGGNFDGTSVFTPTDGSTPASSISAGDYVSLYNTGDTAIRCLAKVVSVAAGVNGAVTIDTTIKYGTVPTSNSGSRNLRKGGAWASLAICGGSTPFGTGTIPQSTRINIKLGTYANTSTVRTFGAAGTAVFSMILEGYKTSPGDMRTQPNGTARVAGTDIPLFTWTTTGSFTCSGAAITLANVAVQTANSGTGLAMSGAASCMDRVQVNNTSTNTAARAVSIAGIATACRFTLGTTTAGTICATAASAQGIYDCVFDGGETGLSVTTGSPVVSGNKFINQSTTGILATTGAPHIVDNTITGALTDGVKWTGVTGAANVIRNNIFDGLSGTMTNAINNASGTNSVRTITRNNRYRNVTNEKVGIPDVYTATTSQSGSETNFTNAAGGDFTLTTGSTAIANASPGTFEGETEKSYKSMGAYQPQNTSAAGGGLFRNPSLEGV